MFRIPKYTSAFLLCSFFLCLCSAIQAQDQRALDTISYMIRNQKNHIQLCDDLYKLGNYYWNIGSIDNAQLAVNTSKELAEKYNYEKGIYDAYAGLGRISLKQNDIAKARSISKECLQLAKKNHSE